MLHPRPRRRHRGLHHQGLRGVRPPEGLSQRDPARRRPNEEGRWIKVSWAEDVEGTFRTTLQVVAKDRINLIVDISTVLSSTKTMWPP